jgi:gluconate 2-dehydrogenase gamma chain
MLTRREFIKTASLLTGSLLFLPACLRVKTDGEEYLVLDSGEVTCLSALCEQIIPADEDPGATEAGVVRFIDRQLHLRFPEEKELFKGGVASLQQWCLTGYGQTYEQLPSFRQIELLSKMENGGVPEEDWTVSPGVFFRKLLSRTHQGYYGSPRHGGNRDYCSYRMLRLDYPLLVGQNRYLKK